MLICDLNVSVFVCVYACLFVCYWHCVCWIFFHSTVVPKLDGLRFFFVFLAIFALFIASSRCLTACCECKHNNQLIIGCRFLILFNQSDHLIYDLILLVFFTSFFAQKKKLLKSNNKKNNNNKRDLGNACNRTIQMTLNFHLSSIL